MALLSRNLRLCCAAAGAIGGFSTIGTADLSGRFAQGHFRNSGHSVQRRRRDRQLFRMGAGSPETVLGRTGRHEETLRDIGPQFRASHAASGANGHIEQKRGALHRSPTGARCQGNEGIVSLRRPALRAALAADCADGRLITGRLCGLNDRKNCNPATERA